MVTPSVINANRVWIKNILQTLESPAFIARAALLPNGQKQYADWQTIIRNEMNDRSGNFSIGSAGEYLYVQHLIKVLRAILQMLKIVGMTFPLAQDGQQIGKLFNILANAQSPDDFEPVKPAIRDLLERYINGIRAVEAAA